MTPRAPAAPVVPPRRRRGRPGEAPRHPRLHCLTRRLGGRRSGSRRRLSTRDPRDHLPAARGGRAPRAGRGDLRLRRARRGELRRRAGLRLARKRGRPKRRVPPERKRAADRRPPQAGACRTGSYTATYRVVSADGHIVSSGFVFSIGKAGTAPSQTVGQLIGKSGSGPSTEIAFGAARALQYGATAIAIGGLVFLLLVWLPALRQTAGADASWVRAAQAFSNRLKQVLYVAAAVGAVSAAAGVVLEGGGGRRGLGLLGSQEPHHSRGARHQVRHDLGTLLRRVGGIRPGLALCPGTSEPAGICAASGGARSYRRRAAAALRIDPPAATRNPTGVPADRARALRPREYAIAGCGALPGQRPPHRRDQRLARRPAALLFIASALPASLSPPERSRLLAAALSRVLADRVGLGHP